MLAAATAAVLLTGQTEGNWPDMVGFVCEFSKVVTVARREDNWEVVTDLRGPMEPLNLLFTVSGQWVDWPARDWMRPDWRVGGSVRATGRSLSLTHTSSEAYSNELPAEICEQGLLGCDPPTSAGPRTWTWFGRPDDVEGVMVVSFVSDRLVATDTGVCRRVQLRWPYSGERPPSNPE